MKRSSLRADGLCALTDSHFFASRREFLSRSGMGMGMLALAALMERNGTPAHGAIGSLMSPKKPPFPARAKHVVHVFAQGAPSQVDTWDPKPELTRKSGKPVGGKGVAFGSPFEFKNHGRSGIPVSEVFPELAKQVDDLAVIRSMHTDIPAHAVATVMMNTGSLRMPKPSLGAWTVYGLGTENQNLPGFISLRSGKGGSPANYQSAFLPGAFQGTSINTAEARIEEMIRNIRNPYLSLEQQRRQLDLVHQYNAIHSLKLNKEDRLEAQISSYELAFSMQTEATDAFDLRKEPQKIRELYGDSAQGKQLLLTRRLIERGVRFVQVWAGGWDHHNNLQSRLRKQAGEIDRPIAAFMTDLKQRGLFDDTLIVWGGEFGRRPTTETSDGDSAGRGHNPHAFSTWLAGGGVKGGTVYGATDEFGAKAVENKVHVHDFHATILALMGFDHTKLTYRHNGRDFRLTDNFGRVVKEVIA